MSHFLDRLQFFKKNQGSFADGHGELTNESRAWEDAYRQRWQHDKIVRSTHGVNCTGSCSWKIYVKNGLVTWETQQTDYPRTRPDLPNHEPRGCQRGASYSWYLYSANRLKYPLARKKLLKLWRETGATILLITHSLDEATLLSDRIGVMSARPGRIIDLVETDWPRDRDSRIVERAEFGAVTARLWRSLRAESMKAMGKPGEGT